MSIMKYDLDINKQAIIKPVVILRQGDHDIDTMQVSLSVANEPMDLTGATVTFMGNTANGRQIIDDAHVKIIDAKGGVFKYVFPSQASSDIGEYKVAYFSIILGNGQSSTMDFRVQVLSGVDISAPVASEYITHYDTMVTALNSAYDSATHETNDKMASTVSSLATSAATVLDSALARVNTINSTANNASSAASKAVSMASSVAGTVTSQASYINSVASSAASSVSSVAASVVNKLNNLSIGGRNLLLGTADWSGGSARWNQRGTVTSNVYRGTLIAATSSPWRSPVYLLQNAGILQVGKTYTFSTYVRNTSDTDTNVAIYYEGGIVTPIGINNPLPAHTDWTRVSTTFKVIKDPTTSTAGLRWEGQHDLTNGQIQFAGYKLEEGNVSTDWTAAPEDADNTFLKKSGDTMTGGLTGGQTILPDSGDLNALTDTGKYYQAKTVSVVNWKNRPVNAPNLAFSVDVIGNGNASLGTQVYYVHTTNRMWVRTIWLDGSMNASPWAELANDANVVHKTGNETAAGDKTFTGKVSVSGELDAAQKIYTRTIGSTNDLLINYTRVGNLVTGRYNTKFGGTFPLGGNDGYKSPSAYPVNVISYNANAWFMPDNKFHADTASTGNFMFVTNDPLPSN